MAAGKRPGNMPAGQAAERQGSPHRTWGAYRWGGGRHFIWRQRFFYSWQSM